MIAVETAQQMQDAVNLNAQQADVVIMAAAVADMRPIAASTSKMKKNPTTGVIDGLESIALEATPDILAGLGASKRAGQVLVGFAAETENLVANAQAKLQRKNVDLIVANNVADAGVGFGHETNAVTLVSNGAEPVVIGLSDKRSIAKSVLDAVVSIRSHSTH
jgi:phosphopantothenoylcysteine decarboxylase/phosphopantothenate--cysteine ligase